MPEVVLVIRSSIELVVNLAALCIPSLSSNYRVRQQIRGLLTANSRQRGMSEGRLAADMFKYRIPVPQDVI